MKKLWKSALLSVILLLLLSACGKAEPPQPTPGASPAPGASPEPGESPVPAADTRYLRYDAAEEARFDLSYEDHSFTGTELILLGQRKKENLLLRFPLAGGETTEIPLDKAYKQAAAGPDCLWLGNMMELVRFTPDGQKTLSLTFQEKIEDLLCDEAGRLYVAHRNSLTLVSDAGETESIPFPKDYTGGTLLRLGSGEIAVFASRVKGEVARFQRVSSDALQPLNVGDASVGVVASGDAAADFYYLEWTNNSQLSEARQVYRVSGGAASPVFDLSGAGREGKVRGFCPAGKGFLLIYGGDEDTGLLRFTPTEAEKKVLTLARLNTNGRVTELIARFNRENPEYYLDTREYYGTEDEQLEALELDILAGDRPDILDTIGVSVEVFEAKGLLRDLYSMIDADPTIRREDLVPSVLHALESESGALYQLWPVFTLWTCAEPKVFVGDMDRWTLEDMYRICEENPALTLRGNYGDQRALLDNTLPGAVDRFADFETGELNFDSPDFVSFLTFQLEMCRRAIDYTGGEYLLHVNSFLTADDFALGLTLAEEQGLQFTGFPCSGGTGQLCFGYYSFSIFEGTGNEEEAWAFMRWFLSEEVMESLDLGMPLRQSVLEAQLEILKNGTPERTVTQFVDPEAAAAGTNTETVTYTIPAVDPLTEEQMATVRRMLDGIEGVYGDSESHPVYFAIWEEYAKLYKGARTAEETAKAIQDRFRIYLAERTP
ncbi:MAG: extracellular solute-binding protein [Oscillospiraceae bacterium]|nr:extracellular solute-binding protein [Oscillospiraceae bacterium]